MARRDDDPAARGCSDVTGGEPRAAARQPGHHRRGWSGALVLAAESPQRPGEPDTGERGQPASENSGGPFGCTSVRAPENTADQGDGKQGEPGGTERRMTLLRARD